jgi:hypothetical protein
MEVPMQRRFTKAAAVLLLILTSTIGPLAASPSDYLISRELSAVSFTVYKWTVLKEEGRFKDISGRVHYDPAQPRDSTVDITISTASLDTNNAGRDGVLRARVCVRSTSDIMRCRRLVRITLGCRPVTAAARCERPIVLAALRRRA